MFGSKQKTAPDFSTLGFCANWRCERWEAETGEVEERKL